MKQFDTLSIKQRMLTKLAANPDWKASLDKSVIEAIVNTVAETNAEMARYMEYLYGESKWDTAQNLRAISATANMLGYRPARKISASGTVIISADPRIHLIGKTLIRDYFEAGAYNATWISPREDMYIGPEAQIISSDGTPYTVTQLTTFAGGQASVSAPVAQGTPKQLRVPVETLRLIAVRSKLDPYIFIPVTIENCEDANSLGTKGFLKVFVEKGETLEEYRIVDTLHLSTFSDRDVEVYPDMYDSSLMYLKFNASIQRGKVLSLNEGSGVTAIVVEYLETKGKDGNLDRSFEPFIITSIAGYSGVTLYGINFDAIANGKAEESILDIKANAPVHYLKTYTTATKEAYESIIKRIDFFGNESYPTRVNVYASEVTDDRTGVVKPVTAVSLILPSLEDIINDSAKLEIIERTLNFNLIRVKAPTDILKFIPPKYVGIAIGVSCIVDKLTATNIPAIQGAIQTTLNLSYGSASSELDFNRPIYETAVITKVKSVDPSILQVSVEMEASVLLDWSSVIRMHPSSGVAFYTARLPFNFNPVFAGDLATIGFKDHRTGSTYVLRFDVLYKQASTSTLRAYHTSIFIKENPLRDGQAFYLRRDAGTALNNITIWDELTASEADYPFGATSGYEELENAGYQYYYKPNVYTDTDFTSLSDSAEGQIFIASQNPGAVDSYLVAFDGSYDETAGHIGEGYLELELSSIYSTLQKYAEQDSQLRTLLNLYPLSLITCNSASTAFDGFVEDVLKTYVEIYVSARPVDKNLVTDPTDHAQNNIVLFADSADMNSSNASTSNLTPVKLPRKLSVKVEAR